MKLNKLQMELANYLLQGHAHAPLQAAVKDFPEKLMNKKAAGLPYTAWQLLEHIRISQWDMIDFCVNKNYKELEWPKDYWPKKNANKKMWAASLKQYQKDLAVMVKLVKNPKTDLFAKIPWGSGQTIFKEALQIIDHNAYHTGEIILLRRVFGAWKS